MAITKERGNLKGIRDMVWVPLYFQSHLGSLLHLFRLCNAYTIRVGVTDPCQCGFLTPPAFQHVSKNSPSTSPLPSPAAVAGERVQA